eukprot:scaffold127755_cov69-Phaeocystis_antarctica.AAC.1
MSLVSSVYLTPYILLQRHPRRVALARLVKAFTDGSPRVSRVYRARPAEPRRLGASASAIDLAGTCE